MRRWLALLILALLPLLGWSDSLVPVPPLQTRVTDQTGTLSAAEQASLSASLAALEKDKGAQVAILLLPTTKPETIEQFGIRLADAWKLGRQGVDDGLIIIVAKRDRKMRIEVGYGLEGAIPDAYAKRIVADHMAPRFRNGDFAGGLQAAVAALDKLIRGEALPAPPAVSQAGEAGPATPSPPAPASPAADFGVASFSFLLLVLVFAGLFRSLFGLTGSLAAAGLAGGLAWVVFAALGAAIGAALLAFGLSFIRVSRGGGQSNQIADNAGDILSNLLGALISSAFDDRSSGGGSSGGGGRFGGGGASG